MATFTDGFESGSLGSGWSTDVSYSVQSATVINGDYSLELNAGPGSATHDFTEGQATYYRTWFRTNNVSEATYVRLYNSGSRSVNLRVKNGDFQYYNGGWNILESGINDNTNYLLELDNFDYSNNAVDVNLDGSYIGVADFEGSANSHDELMLRMGNADHDAWFDSVRVDTTSSPDAPSNLSASYSP